MSGNGVHRFTNTVMLAVQSVDASQVVTSAALDELLVGTYRRGGVPPRPGGRRVGLRPGLLEGRVGIRERRWWADGATFVDGATMAGAKAIGDSGVDPATIGVMINTSISRRYLEPSTAVAVHHALGLPPSCQNFDVTNACLGFLNGMELAAAMIDSGLVEYALIVNGEDSRPVQERTIDRLNRPDTVLRDVLGQFAALTLGSGAVAMVLGRADQHPEGHRLVGSVSRAGTEHHELCVGDNDMMHTDLKGLLEAGLALSLQMWAEVGEEFDWAQGMSRYVMHQVSKVHIQAMCQQLSIDPNLVPTTLPTRGNLGPASVPFPLARETDTLMDGDRLLLMGIGSGLNVTCLEIAW